MSRDLFPSGSLARRPRRRTWRSVLLAGALAGTSIPAAWVAVAVRPDVPPITSMTSTVAPARQADALASDERLAGMLDPTPSWRADALTLAQNAPLESSLSGPPGAPQASSAPGLPSDEEPRQPPEPDPALATARPVLAVPLPVPRPPELGASGAERPQVAGRQDPRRSRTAAAAAAPEDNRSFFEKLFGVRPAASPALGYAALDSGPVKTGPTPPLSPSPGSPADAATAVYDITARVVYLPNGDRLEAHSGLGDKMDDPRYVHVRMHGATPPGTYDLTERERPFHGVRALRLHPVGGSAAIHGRAGLLAHSYLLGPNGDSNGCVSFKDYDKFLQAYLRGEVKRLVVVPGRGQDLLPSIASLASGLRRPSAPDARNM